MADCLKALSQERATCYFNAAMNGIFMSPYLMRIAHDELQKYIEYLPETKDSSQINKRSFFSNFCSYVINGIRVHQGIFYEDEAIHVDDASDKPFRLQLSQFVVMKAIKTFLCAHDTFKHLINERFDTPYIVAQFVNNLSRRDSIPAPPLKEVKIIGGVSEIAFKKLLKNMFFNYDDYKRHVSICSPECMLHQSEYQKLKNKDSSIIMIIASDSKKSSYFTVFVDWLDKALEHITHLCGETTLPKKLIKSKERPVPYRKFFKLKHSDPNRAYHENELSNLKHNIDRWHLIHPLHPEKPLMFDEIFGDILSVMNEYNIINYKVTLKDDIMPFLASKFKDKPYAYLYYSNWDNEEKPGDRFEELQTIKAFMKYFQDYILDHAVISYDNHAVLATTCNGEEVIIDSNAIEKPLIQPWSSKDTKTLQLNDWKEYNHKAVNGIDAEVTIREYSNVRLKYVVFVKQSITPFDFKEHAETFCNNYNNMIHGGRRCRNEHVVFQGRRYVVRGERNKRFIMCMKKPTLLSTIRGKYRKLDNNE